MFTANVKAILLHIGHFRNKMLIVADSGFRRGIVFGNFFCRKLHENEIIWIEKGVWILHCLQHMGSFSVKLFGHEINWTQRGVYPSRPIKFANGHTVTQIDK